MLTLPSPDSFDQESDHENYRMHCDNIAAIIAVESHESIAVVRLKIDTYLEAVGMVRPARRRSDQGDADA